MADNAEQPSSTLEQRRRLRLSGKMAACGLVVAFLGTGVLIPAVLKLPTWIEYEIVLVAWWGIWLAVLTTLLYQGQRVADDHQLGTPRSWLPGSKASDKPADPLDIKKKPASSSGWGGGWYLDFGGDAEGCAWLIVAIVALVALFFALWVLIEVAIPLILFLLYLMTRGMLSHVINDRHRCKGRLLRSFGWACIWATAYTAPLAGVVWCVHYLLAQSAA